MSDKQKTRFQRPESFENYEDYKREVECSTTFSIRNTKVSIERYVFVLTARLSMLVFHMNKSGDVAKGSADKYLTKVNKTNAKIDQAREMYPECFI